MTNKWKKKAKLYKLFDFHPEVSKDYSDESAQAMFEYESTGKGKLMKMVFSNDPDHPLNGYAYGKYWMDWQINAWREGIKKQLSFKEELIQDLSKKYPKEWLEKVLV